MKHRVITVVLMLAMCCGCATMSNRSKTLVGMAAGGVVAGIIGSITAPETDNALAHGALWGAAGAATMGAVGLFVFDEQKRSSEMERKAILLEKEVNSFRQGENDKELVSESQGVFEKEPSISVKKLLTPGKWRLYSLDRWINDGDSRMIHQDQMVEIIPPRLSQRGMGERHEEKGNNNENEQ
jgi:hypothetical protein